MVLKSIRTVLTFILIPPIKSPVVIFKYINYMIISHTEEALSLKSAQILSKNLRKLKISRQSGLNKIHKLNLTFCLASLPICDD